MAHLEGIYIKTTLDNTSIDQNLLNIANKNKSNPLPWNGQFSPQLVQILLNNYAPKNAIVFDPFSGSGTTLLESGELGLECYGTEINPAAIYISKIYLFINIKIPERVLLLNQFENILIKSNLIYNSGLFEVVNNHSTKETFKNLLATITNNYEKILFEALIIFTDFYKNDFSPTWIEKQWNRIKNIVKSLPYSEKEISVIHADARDTGFSDSKFNFVITSPPYINVFNYHQQFRSSTEHLYGSILPVSHSEIGSNRKNRGNRFLTVIQYCLDMSQVFNELKRITQKGSRFIVIMGRESSVRKTSFYNGEIVAEIAYKACDLPLIKRQERVFVNKYGTHIYEDILHFENNKQFVSESIDISRGISKSILLSVENEVKLEVTDDLKNALSLIHKVEPSPKLNRINSMESYNDTIAKTAWR